MRSRTALPSSSLLSFTRTCALTLRCLSFALKAEVDCMDAEYDTPRQRGTEKSLDTLSPCLSVSVCRDRQHNWSHAGHFIRLGDCSFSRQISSTSSVSTASRCFNVTPHGLVYAFGSSTVTPTSRWP